MGLFLFLTILSILVQGFFSMQEMACVSFNKVRLQYYASTGRRRALWLSKLLKKPTRLFGTTLLGVNFALQFGSECSRRFYASIGLSPDLAPITQIFLVLIFAELSPMFAARRYPEHVAMLGIGIINFLSKLLSPIIYFLTLICRFVNWVLRVPILPTNYLTREELQKAIEAREERAQSEVMHDFDMIATNIFGLKNKAASDLMEPLDRVISLPTTASVGQIRSNLKEPYRPFVTLHQKDRGHIVGIAYPRDFIRAPDEASLNDLASPPWFILDTSPLMEIIKEFRVNNQSMAVVLDEGGDTVGILTLDAIVDEIFSCGEFSHKEHAIQIERTYSGDARLSDINQELSITLLGEEAETLEELMTEILDHPPSHGDIARIGRFELIIEDAPLIGELSIKIRSTL